MKKCFLFFFLLFLGIFCFSQSIDQLYRIFEFDYGLPEILQLNTIQIESLYNKFFVINASVLETTVQNTDPFVAKVTVAKGVWDGLDDVNMYRAFMIFEGSQFSAVIPERTPRNITPELIMPNKDLQILCQLIGIDQDGENLFPVFKVYKYKIVH